MIAKGWTAGNLEICKQIAICINLGINLSWNGLPADVILQGEASGWRTILKEVQRSVYVIDIHIVLMLWGLLQ